MTALAWPDIARLRPAVVQRLLPLLMAVVLGLAWAVPAQAASGFSAMAVDAHTGEVLFSQNPDAPRYPASLTKVMTLYVLFEELKAGRLSLHSKLKCSAHGASRPPSKLGLKPGDTLKVEDAVKALVTRSANDVAATIAENISGSEAAFAERMTRTARALGMTRTTFRNASGLPDLKQITTARDMATLGLRIQRDFPQYYHYFRITSFTYKGAVIRSHNRLLGKYPGTDGIKTGYIHASGYNLTASVARKGKRLIGVVMGGRTGASRNAYMTKMLDKHFGKAFSSRVNTIAALAGTPPGLSDSRRIALGTPAPAGSGVPIPKSKPGTAVASAGPSTGPGAKATVSDPKQKDQDVLPETGGEIATLLPEAGAGSEKAPEGGSSWPVSSSVQKDHLDKEMDALATDSLFKIAAAAAAEAPSDIKSSAAEAESALPQAKPSWQIQIGAYPTKDGAMRIIEKALSLELQPLAGKTGFAIPITRGSSTLYRARFSGFDQGSAREACKVLERKGVKCLPLAPQG